MNAGKYRAIVAGKNLEGYKAWRVKEGDTGSVNFSCRWHLTSEIREDGSELDVEALNEEVYSNTNIVMNSGKLNDVGMSVMREVFEWTPKGQPEDFQILEDMDHERTEAVLTIKPETYNGKTSMKVAWIDTSDQRLGGTKPTDLTVIGRKHAHLFGGAPEAPQPQKTTLQAKRPETRKVLDIPEDQIPF